MNNTSNSSNAQTGLDGEFGAVFVVYDSSVSYC